MDKVGEIIRRVLDERGVTPEEWARNKSALAVELSKALTDEGLLIEAGWQGLVAAIYPGVGAFQYQEMRKAFFAGAHHLHTAILSIMDAPGEPTEAELGRMAMIDRELSQFGEELKREAEQWDAGRVLSRMRPEGQG